MDIITRSQAKSQQLSRYFTNKPCKHGHLSERNTASGRCLECDRERGTAFRTERPEVMKEWRKQNPTYASEKYHENKEDRLKQNKHWYEDNKDHCKARHKTWYYSEETQSKLLEWRRTWYAANPEYDKEYYQANHDHLLNNVHPGMRQRRTAKKRQQLQEKFQELAQLHSLPEVPTERDFKYWFAGEIIRRTGWVVNKEVFLDEERTSRIDLLIPEAKIGIEIKLSNHNWVKSQVTEQQQRYQELLSDQGYSVVVISLDGSIGVDAKTFLESLID